MSALDLMIQNNYSYDFPFAPTFLLGYETQIVTAFKYRRKLVAEKLKTKKRIPFGQRLISIFKRNNDAKQRRVRRKHYVKLSQEALQPLLLKLGIVSVDNLNLDSEGIYYKMDELCYYTSRDFGRESRTVSYHGNNTYFAERDTATLLKPWRYWYIDVESDLKIKK